MAETEAPLVEVGPRTPGNGSYNDRDDLAKNVSAVCGADGSGRVVMRRQLRRAQVLGFVRGLPRCAVGIEAPKNPGKAGAAESPAGPNRRELEANMFSVVHARNKPAKISANFWLYLPPRAPVAPGVRIHLAPPTSPVSIDSPPEMAK